MRRLAAFLVRNWPLKIGAIALATVLYGGVVLSENTREYPGEVPIDVRNPPDDAAVLTALDPVTLIRYRAPLEVASRLTSGSFHASVDLAQAQPSADGEVTLGVALSAVDESVVIVDYFPKSVTLELDPLVNRRFPVMVDRGTVPSGLRIGPAQVEPQTIQVEGASTRVASVRTVTARVSIDATGINVDQEVEVVALDQAANQVAGLRLTPDRVLVHIDVARELAYAPLPVVPDVIGEVAPGYQITSIAVDPLSVTVSGEEPVVTGLTAIATEPVDVSGRTGSFELDVALAPPEEVGVSGGSTAHVTVEIGAADGSRTYEVGLSLAGVDEQLLYDLPIGSVLVQLAGPIPVLDSIDVAALPAVVDVADLGPGRSPVPIQVVPPDGTVLVSVTPDEVSVGVTEPAATPTPVASPAATVPASPVP